MRHESFVQTIADRLGCDVQRADAVLYAVLQELRDRITPKEARDVAAQLPTKIKRLWLENDHPDRVVRRMHESEFLGRVRRRALLPDDEEARRAVLVVFAALQTQLGSATGTEGEAWDIFSQLPKDLKLLWLAAGAHHK